MENCVAEPVFCVGGVAEGNQFLGRQRLTRELENIVISGMGARHVVGPTRIGKTSLVQHILSKNRDCPNRFFINMNMGQFENAYAFWKVFASKLKKQIYRAGIWSDIFEECFSEMFSYTPDDSLWWSGYISIMEEIMGMLRNLKWRLILTIDEFDAVEWVFENQPHYYQFLRSVFSEPQYATAGFIISRRRLQLFEAKFDYISTFHGVFPEITVGPFCEEDMEEFYGRLADAGAVISPGGRKKLEYYTGKMPYICCMFGEQILLRNQTESHCDDRLVNQIFYETCNQINVHYDDLVKCLGEDGHLNCAYSLSVGAKCAGISERDLDNMRAMGILRTEKKGDTTCQYFFSRDFMVYLSQRPLKLPIWDTITGCEKKIKSIFAKVYPELAVTSYHQLTAVDGTSLQNKISAQYPELGLNWGVVRGYCQDLSAHKEDPTILDVLTLAKVIKIIQDRWDCQFYRYFPADGDWKFKLEKIKSIRNPIAHAQIEVISDQELAVCTQYCADILRLQ